MQDYLIGQVDTNILAYQKNKYKNKTLQIGNNRREQEPKLQNYLKFNNTNDVANKFTLDTTPGHEKT